MLKASQLRRVIDVLHPGTAYPGSKGSFLAYEPAREPAHGNHPVAPRLVNKLVSRETRRSKRGIDWDSDAVSLDSIEFKRHETISRFESRDPDEPREPKRLRAGRELPF